MPAQNPQVAPHIVCGVSKRHVGFEKVSSRKKPSQREFHREKIESRKSGLKEGAGVYPLS